jgi:fibronectin-binding autotransporter adhesin
MANEFRIKRGFVSDGTGIITGSLTVTQGITGSLHGTASFAVSASVATTSSFTISASFATTSTSASYALTASYALNGGGGSTDTGSLLTTASISGDIITFTKGDGSTFPITIPTSSGSGSIPGGAVSGSFGITIDGAGSTVTTGEKGFLIVPYAGTITGWTLIADQTGNCVIDVWKAAGTIPTVANTITGTEKPTLSSQQIASDLTLTSWTTSVAAGDVVAFNVDSASTITRVNLSIYITKQ